MNATCVNRVPAPGGEECPRQNPPRLRTILLATDLSGGCEDSMPLACSLARDSDARLLVLHVKPDLRPLITYGRARVQLTYPKADGERLQERLQQLQPSDPAVQLEHLLV